MYSGENTLTTSQNRSANDNENSSDKDVSTMKKNESRFDNPGNANDFDYHKRNPQNTSELMKKNLSIELTAQNKRIDADYKRKWSTC